MPRDTLTHTDDYCDHLPSNRHGNVLDSIHYRCFPEALKKAISYHLTAALGICLKLIGPDDLALKPSCRTSEPKPEQSNLVIDFQGYVKE